MPCLWCLQCWSHTSENNSQSPELVKHISTVKLAWNIFNSLTLDTFPCFLVQNLSLTMVNEAVCVWKKQIVSKCFRLVHVKKSLINITETLVLTSDILYLLKSGSDWQGLWTTTDVKYSEGVTSFSGVWECSLRVVFGLGYQSLQRSNMPCNSCVAVLEQSFIPLWLHLDKLHWVGKPSKRRNLLCVLTGRR